MQLISGTDHTITVGDVANLYLTKTDAEATYATLTLTEGFQSEITANSFTIETIRMN